MILFHNNSPPLVVKRHIAKFVYFLTESLRIKRQKAGQWLLKNPRTWSVRLNFEKKP